MLLVVVVLLVEASLQVPAVTTEAAKVGTTAPNFSGPTTKMDSVSPFPLDAIFKPPRNGTNSTKGTQGRGMDWVDVEEAEFDAEHERDAAGGDWETLPDYALTVAASGGHCALAVLHAMPTGPAGKLATMVLLAAALTAVKKALKVPLTVLAQGLFAAKHLLPGLHHRRTADGVDSAYDWASLFEGLHPEPHGHVAILTTTHRPPM